MLSRRQSSGVLRLVLLTVIATAALASGQTFNITPGGFSTSNVCANSGSPASTCQILTNGSPSLPRVITGGILRLNTADVNQHASAWFHTLLPLSTGFTTSFQFRISSLASCLGCSFPADGLALVIQGDPAGTGAIGYTGNGQNIAYGDNDVSTASGPGEAILNSLAIELDTHQNTNYSDPDGNHIAVQSCGPNTASQLTPNSADHNYQCPNGQLAKLALESLPAGLSLSDGNVHTITANYTAPGNVPNSGTCTSNLCIYLDSNLLLQTNVDIAQLLYLQNAPSIGNTAAAGAYIGFTSATGALVQNNDILSWSFSQLPLAPITITQPLQTTATNFNYTSTLNSNVDYSNSGLPSNNFNNVFMQGTAQVITNQQFSDLVNNTPFQGSSCLRQDLGSGTFACVVTSDLCTNSSSSTPAGANCPNTGTSALIGTSNTFNPDKTQKPFITPGYLMAKDTALSCGASGDNTCKGLQNIFQNISGDATQLLGRTKDFNSLLVPVEGTLEPSTSVSTNPALNSGWTNGGPTHSLTLTFNSMESVPSINQNPPSGQLAPNVTSINYTATGANVPTPSGGTITGSTSSISLPTSVEGTTTVTYQGIDSVGTLETITTNNSSNSTVSTSLPTLTIKVDLTTPTIAVPSLSTTSPALGQTANATYSCADGGSGVVLCGPTGSSPISATPNTGTLSSQLDTSTAGSHMFTVSAQDLAGNSAVPVSVAYTVGQGTTTIGLTSNSNPSGLGQAASFSFTVTPSATGVAATGNVTLTASTGETCSATISAGSCSLSFNTAGVRTVKASYSGDGNYQSGASAPVSQNVNQGTTTTAISAGNPNPSAIGQAVPFRVTVTGSATGVALTGNVTLSATTGESCTVAVPASSCSLTFNSAGARNIAASYVGDSNYNGSSAIVVNQSVSQAGTTTAIISARPSPAFPGTPVSISFSISGSTNVVSPSGLVAVKASSGEACSVNVATTIAGVASGSCSLTFSSAGTRTITASYAGDGNFQASSTTSSTQLSLAVGDFTITATPTSQTIPSGHQAAYTITLTSVGGLTGSVNLSCSGGPQNSTCSVSPSVDNLQGVPISSTVTLSASKNVTHGTSTLTFTGSYGGGNLVHAVSVTLSVK